MTFTRGERDGEKAPATGVYVGDLSRLHRALDGGIHGNTTLVPLPFHIHHMFYPQVGCLGLRHHGSPCRLHPPWPGFHRRYAEETDQGVLRRVAHAYRAREGSVHRSDLSAARRAHQPFRPRGVRVAGGASKEIQAHPSNGLPLPGECSFEKV